LDNRLINDSRLKDRKGPCPVCNLHINADDIVCGHCNHELTSDELTAVKKYATSQRLKGTKMGLLIFPIALFILYLVFVIIQYTDI
jgi:uncharacterized membrane protein YvbJ